jgi:uncharacterized protein
VRRRLRKKKHLGEFQQLGFEVLAELRADLSDEDIEAFFDRWMDAVEARHLAFGGGGGRHQRFEGFVTRMGRGSATDKDRSALAAFLDHDAAIVHHHVEPLRDAWYGGWD